MCTVSYIPNSNKNGFILTSNRDEKAIRPTLAPKIYSKNGIDLCFPKDEKAGGSWIAANNKGRLCCLLNGGVVKHEKQHYHTKSRGNVLIEATQTSESVEQYFKLNSFTNVEPFTIITVENSRYGVSELSEFIWDGANKNFRILKKDESYIWSSVTLYSAENRKQRHQWFQNYLNKNNGIVSTEKALSFHTGNFSDNKEINLIMEREGNLKTVSITQVVPKNGKLKMSYSDLLHKQNTSCEL